MTLEPGQLDHILKLARAVQAETYTADGDIPGAQNLLFFREGFTKAYDRFQDAMSPDVAIALVEELKKLIVVAEAAAFLAGDLNRRWTKDHPHRKKHLDPVLEALQALEA